MATIVGTLGASGAAIGALWFTGQSLRATNSQISLAQQTAVTDRFRLATDQLASDNLSVRISGIYLLERLANDSPADDPTVYAVLAAFVRTQSGLQQCGILPHPEPNPVEPRTDIQTALTVIGRRDPTHDDNDRWIDLRRTCLVGADLISTHLVNINLANADLTNAKLTIADLSITDLTGFRHADLLLANLSHAHLTGADLTDARLARADLTGADLRHADLTGADLRDTVLAGVVYDDATQWPSGFTPPPR
ncbi:pentapeptide repeat-containing protein [Nocardia tengchongensis]|uniref:pentapeptide repeat-containing protein n=1 Tax=Nocardia tengchongensis TaxID=2055889 RepID=UPI00369A099C